MPFFGETCPLKSRDQVVSQPNYFQIECVGRKSTSGNLPQRIVLPKLPDERIRQGLVLLDVATREAPQGRVGGAMRAASSEKHHAVANE